MCRWLISISFLKSWFLLISSDDTFQTSVGSEKEDPVFQRGAVCVCAYQAVTSESENKVRRFPPFPQPPAFDPAVALHLRQIILEARQKLSHIGQIYHCKIDPTTGQFYSIHPCIASSRPMIC